MSMCRLVHSLEHALLRFQDYQKIIYIININRGTNIILSKCTRPTDSQIFPSYLKSNIMFKVVFQVVLCLSSKPGSMRAMLSHKAATNRIGLIQ